ncbi:hypothetical protein BZA77DRAFT_355823 [Pyronema omphalodes]|nr:hypothetical protein BZA77DRAFT_355823 [Pyronema omphalodes]
MSGLNTPTTEFSIANRESGISSANIGNFIIRVLCDKPRFDKDVLVIVDENHGIENAMAEFEEALIHIVQKINDRYISSYSIHSIEIDSPDDDDSRPITVSLRQLMHIIWSLPRTPGLTKASFFSLPDHDTILVTL